MYRSEKASRHDTIDAFAAADRTQQKKNQKVNYLFDLFFFSSLHSCVGAQPKPGIYNI